MSPAPLALLLALAAPQSGYSDADVAVLVRQALVSDVRHGTSPDALGRSANVRPDLDVARDVQAVLKARLGGRLGNLAVSCNHGEVVLAGRVERAEDAAHAGRLAAAVPGARSVVNKVSPDGSSAETGRAPAAEPASAVTEPFVFLTEDGLAASGVVAAVEDGVVLLTGLASSTAARDYATSSARLVPGARLVRNDMETYAGDETEDERLGLMIARRLEWSVDLRPVAEDLAVVVRHGVVTLTGTVRTRAQHQEAVDLAASTRGIVVVDDRILLAGN